MPSTQVISQSGGVAIVSGSVYSGTLFPVGGVHLKLSASGAGPVYVCLPPPAFSGGPTLDSGGSLSSGGLGDGIELSPGDTLFVPKIRLVSGVATIRVQAPSASSGARLYWECF